MLAVPASGRLPDRVMEGRQIKGKLLLSARKAVKIDTDGVDLVALNPQLSAPAKRLLTDRFIASAWYPNEAIDEVIAVVAARCGVTDEQYSFRLGRQSVALATGPIVSTAVSVLATPQRIVRYLGSFWGQLYDSGEVTGHFDASTGRVQIELRGWKGHTRVQCFNPLGALVEVCVRSERAKYVSHELLACVSQGADACRYAVQFER